MDDLAGKLQEILGSEEGMRQLQEMANMLGLSGEAGDVSPPPGTPDRNGLFSGLSPAGQPAGAEPPPISAAELARLGALLQSTRQETPSAALLGALRPFLRESRQKKVDTALKILRLLPLLPLLRESGLFSGLTGEETSP